MTNHERAEFILQDILQNHLPRIKEGLEKGYVDENQILVIYDHAVRARILIEHPRCDGCGKAATHSITNADGGQQKHIEYYCEKCDGGNEGKRTNL